MLSSGNFNYEGAMGCNRLHEGQLSNTGQDEAQEMKDT